MVGNDNSPGRENQDIKEENEQKSQEEIEVREEDKDLRELFQAQLKSIDKNKR